MSGRLTRGLRYANNGSVRSLQINDNKISATVSGSYGNHYNVLIEFRPFSKKQKDKVFQIIENNPLILAGILNRELPSELESMLIKENIFLLPQRWQEMARDCSCPDWGDPCKHMAAVYFLLASEIDKNPFTIFEIRGGDLLSKFSISSESLEIEYPINIEFPEQKQSIKDGDIQITSFASSSAFILTLLGDSPPFSNINYRTVMEEFYKKSAKSFSKLIFPIVSENISQIERIFKESDITVKGDEKIYPSVFEIRSDIFKDDLSVYELFSGFNFKKLAKGIELNSLEMARIFISFESDTGSKEYKFFYYLFRIFYLLLESSGFVPAVLPTKKESFVIYKPLLSVPEIKKQIEMICEFAPPVVKYKKEFLEQKASVNFILTLLLTHYAKKLKFMHKAQKNNPPQISHAFFKGECIKADSFETKEIPRSVSSWLAVFDIANSEYEYSVFINKQQEYSIGINILKGEKKLQLKDAIEQFDKITILKFLSLIRIYLPEVEQLLNKEMVETERGRLEEFILKTVLTLSNLGVNVVLPKELKNILSPKPVISAKSSAKSCNSYISLNKLLDYEWQISIGDKLISVDEFNKMVQKGHELVEFNNQFVRVSAEQAKRIFTDLKKKEKLSSFDILKANLKNELVADSETLFLINNLLKGQEYKVPKSLCASLRHYQQRGFQWAVNNLINGFGVILADDMGLGKTIQAITILLHMKTENLIKEKVIIVAPTTLLSNWEKEIEKFAPSLSFFSYHGAKRELQSDKDIVITTYQLVMRDAEILKKEKFDCIIIDEAQYIKNPDTKTTKAVKKFKAKYKIALSGTPVENNLSELWSIFDFSIPKYLKTLKQFRGKKVYRCYKTI